MIQPIDYFLVGWFAVAAASTAYVAWDQYRNNPEPVVMKWFKKRQDASARTDGMHSEHSDHRHHAGGGEHAIGDQHDMASDATPAQRAALAGVSLFMLVVGMLAPANWVNLRLSAHEVGGAIMPPGMIMDRDVIWKARQPGKWLIHCHIGHHTTNNNVEMRGGGGLMMVIDVSAR